MFAYTHQNEEPVTFDFQRIHLIATLLLGRTQADALLADRSPAGTLEIIATLESAANKITPSEISSFPITDENSIADTPQQNRTLLRTYLSEIRNLRRLPHIENAYQSEHIRIRGVNQFTATYINKLELNENESLRISLTDLPHLISSAESTGTASITIRPQPEQIAGTLQELEDHGLRPIHLVFQDELQERPEILRNLTGNITNTCKINAKLFQTSPKKEALEILSQYSGAAIPLNSDKACLIDSYEIHEDKAITLHLHFPELQQDLSAGLSLNGALTDSHLNPHCARAYGCNAHDFFQATPELVHSLTRNLQYAANQWFVFSEIQTLQSAVRELVPPALPDPDTDKTERKAALAAHKKALKAKTIAEDKVADLLHTYANALPAPEQQSHSFDIETPIWSAPLTKLLKDTQKLCTSLSNQLPLFEDYPSSLPSLLTKLPQTLGKYRDNYASTPALTLKQFVFQYSLLARTLPRLDLSLEPTFTNISHPRHLQGSQPANPEFSYVDEALRSPGTPTLPRRLIESADPEWKNQAATHAINQHLEDSHDWIAQIQQTFELPAITPKAKLLLANHLQINDPQTTQIPSLDQPVTKISYPTPYLDQQEFEAVRAINQELNDSNEAVETDPISVEEHLQSQHQIDQSFTVNPNVLHRLTTYSNFATDLPLYKKQHQFSRTLPALSLPSLSRLITPKDCLTPDAYNTLTDDEVQFLHIVLADLQNPKRTVSPYSKNPIETNIHKWLHALDRKDPSAVLDDADRLLNILQSPAIASTTKVPFTISTNRYFSNDAKDQFFARNRAYSSDALDQNFAKVGNKTHGTTTTPLFSNPTPLKLLCGTGLQDLQDLSSNPTLNYDWNHRVLNTLPILPQPSPIPQETKFKDLETAVATQHPSTLLQHFPHLYNTVGSFHLTGLVPNALLKHCINQEANEIPDLRTIYLKKRNILDNPSLPNDPLFLLISPIKQSYETLSIEGEEVPLQYILNTLQQDPRLKDEQKQLLSLTPEEHLNILLAPTKALNQWTQTAENALKIAKQIFSPSGKEVTVPIYLSNTPSQKPNQWDAANIALNEHTSENERNFQHIITPILTHRPQNLKIVLNDITASASLGPNNQWIPLDNRPAVIEAITHIQRAQDLIDGKPISLTEREQAAFTEAKTNAGFHQLSENLPQVQRFLDSHPMPSSQYLAKLTNHLIAAQQAVKNAPKILSNWKLQSDSAQWGWNQQLQLNPTAEISLLLQKLLPQSPIDTELPSLFPQELQSDAEKALLESPEKAAQYIEATLQERLNTLLTHTLPELSSLLQPIINDLQDTLLSTKEPLKRQTLTSPAPFQTQSRQPNSIFTTTDTPLITQYLTEIAKISHIQPDAKTPQPLIQTINTLQTLQTDLTQTLQSYDRTTRANGLSDTATLTLIQTLNGIHQTATSYFNPSVSQLPTTPTPTIHKDLQTYCSTFLKELNQSLFENTLLLDHNLSRIHQQAIHSLQTLQTDFTQTLQSYDRTTRANGLSDTATVTLIQTLNGIHQTATSYFNPSISQLPTTPTPTIHKDLRTYCSTFLKELNQSLLNNTLLLDHHLSRIHQAIDTNYPGYTNSLSEPLQVAFDSSPQRSHLTPIRQVLCDKARCNLYAQKLAPLLPYIHAHCKQPVQVATQTNTQPNTIYTNKPWLQAWLQSTDGQRSLQSRYNIAKWIYDTKIPPAFAVAYLEFTRSQTLIKEQQISETAVKPVPYKPKRDHKLEYALPCLPDALADGYNIKPSIEAAQTFYRVLQTKLQVPTNASLRTTMHAQEALQQTLIKKEARSNQSEITRPPAFFYHKSSIDSPDYIKLPTSIPDIQLLPNLPTNQLAQTFQIAQFPSPFRKDYELAMDTSEVLDIAALPPIQKQRYITNAAKLLYTEAYIERDAIPIDKQIELEQAHSM